MTPPPSPRPRSVRSPVASLRFHRLAVVLAVASTVALALALAPSGLLAQAQAQEAAQEAAPAAAADRLAEPPPELVERARALLAEHPIVDGHNDLPWQYRSRVENHLDHIDLRGDTTSLDPPLHTDIPRLRAGGVGAQFWSVYIPVSLAGPGAVGTTLEQIDVVHRLAERYPDVFEVALTSADVRRIVAEGEIASLIGLEGGHSIHNSLAVLRQMYNAGARYMTLTHSANTDWADSSTDEPEHGGLSSFGEEVVREMNRLGMLVDLSHVSAEAMHDALEVSRAPVIFSHSSARAVTPHPRNVPDDVLRRMADNGGVVMVTFVEPFVSEAVRLHGAERRAERTRLESLYPGDPETVQALMDTWAEQNPTPRAHLADVADHIDHLVAVAGIDHVGIGSDYDGIPRGPVGLEDVSRFPHLFAELLERGYSEEDLAKIAGGNALRVFERAEAVAARLRAEEPASDRGLEDLAGAAPEAR